MKLTEAALDIARIIVREETGERPDTNPAAMRTLGDLSVLAPETTEEMVEAARFRNVLAHTYGEDIDHELVYDALKDLSRYRIFLVEVRDFLIDSGALNEL